MPKVSDRATLMKEMDSFLKWMAMMDEDGTEDFEEIMDIRASLEEVRFINLRKYETKKKPEFHAVVVCR